MVYARPSGSASSATPKQSHKDNLTDLSTTTLADNRSTGTQPTPPRLRRVTAPAILPPVVASTSSTLHLALKEPSTASGHSLSKQVDELLIRHLNSSPNHGAPVARVKSPAPPPIPPKQSPAQVKMARGPLPLPPPPGSSSFQNQQQQQYDQQQARPVPHQYPASYGPSISKIRSFSAQPPSRNDGLPPSLIPGGGRGQDYYIQQQYPQAPYQPWPQQRQQPIPQVDTVSRSFARGGASILLHKGFFDLLSVQGAAAPRGSTANEGWYGDRPTKPTATLRAVTAPVFPLSSSQGQQKWQQQSTSPGGAGPPVTRAQARGNRRISVDMVGKPMGFTHLAHASDAEQAEEILTRWRVDGNGKLAEPAWVVAIKEAARTRARAQGVAQVQAYQDAEHQKGSLKVMNANPDSLISNFSNRAESGSHDGNNALPVGLPPMASPGLPSPLSGTPLNSPGRGYGDYLGASGPTSPLLPASPTMDDRIIVHEEIPRKPIQPSPNMRGAQQKALAPPPNMRANTAQTMIVRNGDMLEALREGMENDMPVPVNPHQPSSPNRSPPSPQRYKQDANGDMTLVNGKAFKPSLETVERSVATKIYLENHYYGILKRPRDRDQRRAALERELTVANMTDSQRRAIRAAWTTSETEHLRDLRNRVHPNSFLKVKTIGHGAFGVVSLVREKGSGELYAMKQLRKADMLRKGQEGHVRAERDVMSAASSSSNSRWIVKLVYSFQDTDHLYLVMEYMGGGDLLNLLIEKDIFEESFAKFYIAEMVLAVQEAHKLGYIHRDIKPDNFIFSSDGHIKLSDFGLATDFHWAHDGAYYEQQRRQLLRKHGIDLEESAPLAGGKRFHSNIGLDFGDLPLVNGTGVGEDDVKNSGVLTWRDKHRKKLAYSVVGTNSYMSPEVIRGTGYDQSCDWWSLGIILFECIYGYPPFVSKSRHITRQKILTWRQSLRFPSKPRVSREVQDLISRLICEREDRLGSRTAPSTIRANSIVLQQRRSGFLGPAPGFPSLKDGAEDIKAHPWFRGIDFKTLHLQEPPFKPELKDPSDTRYFDDDINDEPLAAPDAQPGQAEATKDPMLRDKVHGKHLLDVRKQLAFQGYTFKSPKQRVFDPRNGLRDIAANMEAAEDDARGRSMLREPSSGFRRAMSL